VVTKKLPKGIKKFANSKEQFLHDLKFFDILGK